MDVFLSEALTPPLEAMKHLRIKPSDFRSPIICWALFVLFSFMFVIYQLVDVVPYPHMRRDWLIGSLIIGGAALGFLWLALSFRRQATRLRERLRNGHCVSCGYDLTGNISGVCPECGEPVHGCGIKSQFAKGEIS